MRLGRALDGGWSGGTLDTVGRVAGGVGALGVAADGDGLDVGELDLDVLLVDAGQLAVQLIGVLDLLDVELGGEGFQDVAAGPRLGCVLGALRVLLEVVEEAEERMEGGAVRGRGWGQE